MERVFIEHSSFYTFFDVPADTPHLIKPTDERTAPADVPRLFDERIYIQGGPNDTQLAAGNVWAVWRACYLWLPPQMSEIREMFFCLNLPILLSGRCDCTLLVISLPLPLLTYFSFL